MSKQVKLCTTTNNTDDVLGNFYRALASNNSNALKNIHIPRSDVFYVRQAIYNDTGTLYSLDHVERAMYLEGHLDRKDVLDPDRKRPYAD